MQIFLEPEGRDTPELYVQGFSTGLPERLQLALLRTLPGAIVSMLAALPCTSIPSVALVGLWTEMCELAVYLLTWAVQGVSTAGAPSGSCMWREGKDLHTHVGHQAAVSVRSDGQAIHGS